MTAREEAHRRLLLVSTGALIILSMTPVFGHHVASRADALLAGRDHFGQLCLIALHHLLEPVHFAFHALLVAGISYALWDRLHAWQNVTRTLGALDARAPSSDDPIGTAAGRAGLALDRMHVVDGLPNPAFTAGFWRPRVFVAAVLPEVLTASQLHAVLAHELAHVRRRDPLRLSLLRFLALTLFYIPALRRLADDLGDQAEIDADDAAAAQVEPLVVASTILALAEWRIPSPAWLAGGGVPPVATLSGFQPVHPSRRVDLLERRVRRLSAEPTTPASHVTRRSLAAAAAVLATVWISGVMMAHPLRAGAASAAHGAASHCQHPGSFAITHLFCLGDRAQSAGGPCPHMGL